MPSLCMDERTGLAMLGKRGSAWSIPGKTQPRKRPRNEGDCRVHLDYSNADDIRVHEVVEFINRMMEKEFRSFVGRDGAIVNHAADPSGNSWVLEAASADLANRVCHLNGIYYKYQRLNLKRFGAPPVNWCWNDYHLHQYGKNTNFVDCYIEATVIKPEASSGIDGLKLQTILNQKMQEFRLADTNAITNTVKVTSDEGGDKFLLCMRTVRYASRLTYLNQINIDDVTVTLNRLQEWKGEEPRYKNFGEFLKAFGSEEAIRTPANHVLPMDSLNTDKHIQESTASHDAEGAQDSNYVAIAEEQSTNKLNTEMNSQENTAAQDSNSVAVQEEQSTNMLDTDMNVQENTASHAEEAQNSKSVATQEEQSTNMLNTDMNDQENTAAQSANSVAIQEEQSTNMLNTDMNDQENTASHAEEAHDSKSVAIQEEHSTDALNTNMDIQENTDSHAAEAPDSKPVALQEEQPTDNFNTDMNIEENAASHAEDAQDSNYVASAKSSIGSDEGEFDPWGDSEEEKEQLTPAPSIDQEESSSFGATLPFANVQESECGEQQQQASAPFLNDKSSDRMAGSSVNSGTTSIQDYHVDQDAAKLAEVSTANDVKTLAQDDEVDFEPDTQPAAVEMSASGNSDSTSIQADHLNRDGAKFDAISLSQSLGTIGATLSQDDNQEDHDTANGATTLVRDDIQVDHDTTKPGDDPLGCKPAAFPDDVTTTLQDEPNDLNVVNGQMESIIAEHTTDAWVLRASLKVANEKLAKKDERIADLEKIVEQQKRDLEQARGVARFALFEKSKKEDERIGLLQKTVEVQRKAIDHYSREMLSKEREVGGLRTNCSILHNDLEEQRRILAIREQETASLRGNLDELAREVQSTATKLDVVHESWGEQSLMLEAKDRQISVLEAKLEAALNEKAELQKRWKEAFYG